MWLKSVWSSKQSNSKLLNTTKQTAIDKNQFIQSVVDNLRARLCELNEIDAHIFSVTA